MSGHEDSLPFAAQQRFERLFHAPTEETEVALAVHGLRPWMLGLPEMTVTRERPASLLDDTFAWLSPPPRKPPVPPTSTTSPNTDIPTSDDVLDIISEELALAIISHPPAPLASWSNEHLKMDHEESVRARPLPPLADVDSRPDDQGFATVDNPRTTTRANPTKRIAVNAVPESREPVGEAPIDFSATFAREQLFHRIEESRRKRLKPEIMNSPYPSDNLNPTTEAEDELSTTLAKNPYAQAFAMQHQQRLQDRAMRDFGPGSENRLGGFRTAASKLGSDKRTAPKTQQNRPNPREVPRSVTSEDDGDAAARVITSAVLGPARRPRFCAPKAADPHASATKAASTAANLPEIPNVEPRLVEMIMNDALDRSPGVDWDDIAGLHFAKRCVMEAVVWPMKRPDIFVGLRGPPKGLLLFGPPGTGKTLIGRAIASKSGAKFFNISASSLMSKWVGEGEKMVRALFAVARVLQPSVVFIDEIDSLLTQRTESDQESSRRVKTEFLVQMDGAGTSREDRVLVVGATNRPAEIDEAARRRLVKRLYIPLPDDEARASLVARVLKGQSHSMDAEGIQKVVALSKGYSGSDMYALCAEAALGPVRDLGEAIGTIDAGSVRQICLQDFENASRMVRASVSEGDLDGYIEWNKVYGSFPIESGGAS